MLTQKRVPGILAPILKARFHRPTIATRVTVVALKVLNKFHSGVFVAMRWTAGRLRIADA